MAYTSKSTITIPVAGQGYHKEHVPLQLGLWHGRASIFTSPALNICLKPGYVLSSSTYLKCIMKVREWEE